MLKNFWVSYCQEGLKIPQTDKDIFFPQIGPVAKIELSDHLDPNQQNMVSKKLQN